MSVPHITLGAAVVIVPSGPSGRVHDPRGTGPGGRAPASTVAPVPARCGSSRPAASPTLSGTLRHETVRLRAPGGCGRPAPRPWRHRPARGAVRRGTASRAVARRRWTAPVPTRGRPVVRRTPDGRRSTGRHSSRRPPPRQRAAYRIRPGTLGSAHGRTHGSGRWLMPGLKSALTSTISRSSWRVGTSVNRRLVAYWLKRPRGGPGHISLPASNPKRPQR